MMNLIRGGVLILVVALGWAGLRRWAQGGQVESSARMDGKVVVITGANTGIGKETALDLALRGAEVHMLCRDLVKAEAALDEIEAASKTKVYLHQLDLSSQSSVRACAQKLNTILTRIDVLINNAGVMACPEWRTSEGFEMQFATNHLGHFLLTNLLLPLLRSSSARVIVLSSLAHKQGKMDWEDLHFHKKPYQPMEAYSQSKLANILFANELARRESSLAVFSVHPGVVKTELSRTIYEVYGPLRYYLMKLLAPFLKTAKSGAQTSIHCAIEDLDKLESGGYFADCAKAAKAPQAESASDAKTLWTESLKQVALAD